MRRIAVAQTVQTSDFDANVQTIFRVIEEAAAEGVQILCFPETQTVGYRVDITPTDRPVPIDQPVPALHALASENWPFATID